VSRRSERVAALIRRIVAEAIQHRLSDPRIPTITSITRVEVSDDFSLARIYVSVMAPPVQRKLALDALQSAAGRLRRMVAPELQMRKLPLIEFWLDDSVRHGLDTLAVIDHAMRELGERPEWERTDEDNPEELAGDETADAEPDRAAPAAADQQDQTTDRPEQSPAARDSAAKPEDA
jgi:ribosome-binding factor A